MAALPRLPRVLVAARSTEPRGIAVLTSIGRELQRLVRRPRSVHE
jgi:hypothetical protein